VDVALGLTPKYVATTTFLTETSQVAYTRVAEVTHGVGERINKLATVPASVADATHTAGLRITETADKVV
jgi:hypothetical protein